LIDILVFGTPGLSDILARRLLYRVMTIRTV